MLFTPVAFQIPLQDAGGYYTAPKNVENALQQIGAAGATSMPTQRIKGRTTAGTGAPENLTGLEAAAIVQGDGLDVDMCGYRGVPQTSFSANTTIAALHCGRTLYHPATDANARTLTIDSNANLALEIGFTFSIINDTANVVTLAITADTLVWAGVGTTGSRSLAQYAFATVTKVTATRWFISGVGIT